MSDANPENPNPRLSDDHPLYRAVLNAKWTDGDTVLYRVFMRRPPHPETGEERDKDGLSVALANGKDEITTCREEAARFKNCRAVCRILTGVVRAKGLEVLADAPDHANIIGLPAVPLPDIDTDEGKQARADAQRWGDDLAEQALVVWHAP